MIRNLTLSLVCACFCLVSAFTQETDRDKDKRMQWFADAELGILIHWGICAVASISSPCPVTCLER